MKHRDFMFATSSTPLWDGPVTAGPSLSESMIEGARRSYLDGCTMPGCCAPEPCDAPTAADFVEVARWMDGFDARALVSARKRGWRIPGRLRLGRIRLYQAFAGLS